MKDMRLNKKYPNIAIDGPAGAGKSTVAKEVSRRLGITYLDTGAMYRAVTLKVIRENVDLDDPAALEALLDHTAIRFDHEKKVYLDGEDVTEEIRLADVNELVSPVSCISLVRRRLVAMQQEIAREAGGIIMEGRDIGSRVMPDAEFKFYLDASLEERARRRSREQMDKGISHSEDQVASEIKNRDQIDSGREDSPLTIVPDAIVIDTTDMSFDQVVEKIVNTVTLGR
jgi:CMP/dCMP kinase